MMPVFNNVKTTAARQVWQSPDGQRKIHEVTLETDAGQLQAQTFSDAIASIGWNGDVEAYDKAGNRGPQTFVKQAPKENQYSSPSTDSSSSNSTQSTRTGSTYQPKDEAAIKAMFAIKTAVQAYGPNTAGVYDDYFADLETYATKLFAMVDRVKAGTPAEQPDVIQPVNDGPVDMSQLDAVFGPSQSMGMENKWNPGL
jgi:hypothetical protein